MISSSTSAKRSVALRNSPLHELLCVSQKVACLTCALICDWRRHPIANQSWLQMPALLDFSISFVVNDTAELEVDPAPAPSLCLRKQCGCGWAVHRLAWQQRAQRAHEEHVVLSMNDFDEQPLSRTRKSKILSIDFLKRHLSLLACCQSTPDAWRKTDALFQVSATYVFETLEGLSFTLLFKLKVHVTASFSADLRDMTLTSVNARSSSRVAPFVHGSHARGQGRGRSFAPQCVRQKQTNAGVNERSFVKKVRSWKSQTNNIRMFEHSLQL